jgi:hypothetical protein
MSCPTNEPCNIEAQLEQKRIEELKKRPKTIKYAKGLRSTNWKLQYEAPKEN